MWCFWLGFFVCTMMFVACGEDDRDSILQPDGGESSSSATPKSNSSETSVSTGSLTDDRDGQTYKTIKIGDQWWMAENLNYAYTGVPYNYRVYTSDSTSWCYDNDPANCTKYGRLYTWAAAMDSVETWKKNGKGCGYGKTCSPTYPVRGVCPTGWHLPAKAEFEILFTAVGGRLTAGEMLKATSGWDSNCNGTDAFGFSVLPVGHRSYDGRYRGRGRYAYFWSSTEEDSDSAYLMYLDYSYIDNYGDSADMFNRVKYSGISVRCVKD